MAEATGLFGPIVMKSMQQDTRAPPVISEGEWLYVPVRHEDEAEFSPNLVKTLARVFDVPADALPPIADSVDPDVLDALFAKRRDGGRRVEGFQFQYSDRIIRIDSPVESDFAILQVEVAPSDSPGPAEEPC